MKAFLLVRLLLLAGFVALAGWGVHETEWVETTVYENQRGAAADDPHYSLRRILQAAGATLEVRSALEPLPPPGATLLLDSSLWDIFPGRSERLQAWVRGGGHLVIQGFYGSSERTLRWLPISFHEPRAASAAGGATTLPRPRPAPSASAPGDVVGATLPPARNDDDDDETIGPDGKHLHEQPFDHPFDNSVVRRHRGGCRGYVEPGDSPEHAFEPGHVVRGCAGVESVRSLAPAVPAWKLVDRRKRVLALRVNLGRGSVTGVSTLADLGNRAVLQADNGQIIAAILQARPGKAVWIVEDEAREALPLWMWHEARAPTLLILAAVLLALWRLLPRFGPRVAPPPQGRRSMGEQVAGTGQFIAAAEPRALHAAARAAFDAVGRTRIEGWAEHDDGRRVAALAEALGPTSTLDRAALLAALAPPPAAPPAQILAAIGVVEQARRALLRAPASPFAH